MRQETSEWIKDAGHSLVVPVRKALFGGWEGNWMATTRRWMSHYPGDGRNPAFPDVPQAQSGANATIRTT